MARSLDTGDLLETLGQYTQRRPSEVLRFAMSEKLFEREVTSGSSDGLDDTVPGLDVRGVVDRSSRKSAQNSESLFVSALGNEPSRRLGHTVPPHREEPTGERVSAGCRHRPPATPGTHMVNVKTH